EGRSALFSAAPRAPRRGLLAGRTGDPAPAATRVRAVPALSQLRLRFPLLALQRGAHGSQTRAPSCLPLLRRAHGASVRCPECGGAVLEAIGAGTERVADRFAEAFPGVAHAVLDRDTARRRGAGAVVEDMLSG